ncbi:LLM class flavin-dependent oxidoreductase [Hamadaea sp. NPDC051192]|uniref:LLM class flavin-dependent oxidoreductase n=1 Tax=Hamadaea sp. NPDC051192 TaxID=3154940 RepID=UPI003424AF3A
MRFGIYVAILGDLADPRKTVQLARTAEAAGWDALFVWDHLAFTWGPPAADAWVTLSAAATATDRLLLGPAVTPLARRRPVVVAQTVATLDLLSSGRVVFTAGLGGVEAEFTAFGENAEPKTRAARLDEGLSIVDRLWRGEPVTHTGEHYTVDGVTLAPLPVTRPRVPIWIGGYAPPALRRAAAWDGWVGGGDDQDGRMTISPAKLHDIVGEIGRHRATMDGYEVAMSGVSTASDGSLVQAYADAGLTWWLEHLHGYRGDFATLLERVAAGPPH